MIEMEYFRKTFLDLPRCKAAARALVDAWIENEKVTNPSHRKIIQTIVDRNIEMVHARSESPIETLFFCALSMVFAREAPVDFIMVPTIPGFRDKPPELYTLLGLKQCIHCFMQPTVTISGSDMRPDAVLWNPSRAEFTRPIAVECDGYAFHSTKERFISDRKRDRVFQSEGVDVFRYAGSEIYANPVKVASDFSILLDERLSTVESVPCK